MADEGGDPGRLRHEDGADDGRHVAGDTEEEALLVAHGKIGHTDECDDLVCSEGSDKEQRLLARIPCP